MGIELTTLDSRVKHLNHEAAAFRSLSHDLSEKWGKYRTKNGRTGWLLRGDCTVRAIEVIAIEQGTEEPSYCDRVRHQKAITGFVDTRNINFRSILVYLIKSLAKTKTTRWVNCTVDKKAWIAMSHVIESKQHFPFTIAAAIKRRITDPVWRNHVLRHETGQTRKNSNNS